MSPGRLTHRGAAVLALWAVAVQVGGLAVAAGTLHADSSVLDASAPAPTDDAHRLPPPATPPAAPPTTTTTMAPPPPPPSTVPPPPPPTTVAPSPVPPPAAPPPRPAPSTTVPPATVPPAPPTTAPQAPAGGLLQQLIAPYQTSVPSVWRNAITVSFEIIPGDASYAWPSGRIQVSLTHALGGLPQLRTTLAHEFGHLIAYRYGSQARAGAPPSGWPYSGPQPNEAWADCVSQVFTGIADPSHGLSPCPGPSLAWASTWLAAGPGKRTDGGG